MSAQEAFDGLAAFAATGSAFTNAMIFRIPPPDADPEEVVANGYVLTRALDVPDRDRDGTVPAVATVRVLRKHDGSLLLRARVEWTTSAGAHHAAQAAYAIESAANAQAGSDVMATQRLGMPRAEAIGTGASAIIDYGATWRQEYPGALDDDYGFEELLEQENARTLEERHTTALTEEYHKQVVVALGANHPEMLCMLSESVLGSVHPDELDKVFGWVRQQPEYVS
jgi:hypothetical protein